MGNSRMWTHSICFTGIQCRTKTSASLSFFFLFLVPLISLPHGQFFLRRQTVSLHFCGQFPCLTPCIISRCSIWSSTFCYTPGPTSYGRPCNPQCAWSHSMDWPPCPPPFLLPLSPLHHPLVYSNACKSACIHRERERNRQKGRERYEA